MTLALLQFPGATHSAELSSHRAPKLLCSTVRRILAIAWKVMIPFKTHGSFQRVIAILSILTHRADILANFEQIVDGVGGSIDSLASTVVTHLIWASASGRSAMVGEFVSARFPFLSYEPLEGELYANKLSRRNFDFRGGHNQWDGFSDDAEFAVASGMLGSPVAKEWEVFSAGFKCCATYQSANYCSKECQALDGKQGHREYPEPLTTREKSFMRTLLSAEYRGRMSEVCCRQAIFMHENPGEAFFTVFVFTARGVEIKICRQGALTSGEFDVTMPPMFTHVARSGWRMEVHVMCVYEGEDGVLRIARLLPPGMTRSMAISHVKGQVDSLIVGLQRQLLVAH
ncbi:hypothetical protein FB451DRAFT_1185135 [Mycena latifolia]|nr:hypothetical protein FB451DRAFT_1185135 [Mycena latifolia]